MVQRMTFSVAVALEAGPNEPVLFRGDVLESAKMAQQLGYDAIEIHLRKADLIDLDALKRHCDETGFGVSAFATGLAKRVDGLSFIDDNTNIRAGAVQRVKHFVDAASKLEAGVIIGSLRGNIPSTDAKNLYLERFFACMGEIAAYAEDKQTNIYLEVINRYENNYLNNVEESLPYVQQINSKRVKLHLDTFHMNIEENDMAQAIRQCGEHLGYIHLADNTRLAVGTGSIDFAAVIKAAQDVDYQGVLSLECLPKPSPQQAARQSIQALEKLYQRRS